VPDVNAPGYAQQVAEAIAIVNASADEKDHPRGTLKY
jgi:hypothetical protein